MKKWFLPAIVLVIVVAAVLAKTPDEQIVERSNSKVPPEIQKTASVGATVRVPILMYHYVEYVLDKGDKIRLSLDTSPVTFESEIKTLSENGYSFMTAADVGKVLAGEKSLPVKPAVLTFDDGYRDFYTVAYPILKKYQAKATAYIVPGFLDRPNYLLTSQLQEIARSGLVEIGAHTVHHVSLRALGASKLSAEVVGSKQQLEKLIGQPVVSFAYPYGTFDLAAIAAVKSAGFTTAVSTVAGMDQGEANRDYLYRLRSGGRTGKILLAWLEKLGSFSSKAK